MQTIAGIPYEIVSIVIAAIIFFVAIQYVIGLLFKNSKPKQTKKTIKQVSVKQDSAGPAAYDTTNEGGQG